MSVFETLRTLLSMPYICTHTPTNSFSIQGRQLRSQVIHKMLTLIPAL